MDTSGFFTAIMVFIGIFYIVVYEIIKNAIKQNEIRKQNAWRKNIYNFPKHNK